MRNISIRHCIVALICFVTCLSMKAAVWTPDNLPVPYLQDHTQYVSNPDGVLSAAIVDSINRVMHNLEKQHGVQSLVIAVTNIKGDDPYEFCMQVGKIHGIGSKQNTGLIVLLASDDRGYQILTGNGLEGTLPDGLCRRIQNRVTIPLLKQGKWDEAMLETSKALAHAIEGDQTLTSQDRQDEETETDGWDALIGFAITFVLGLSVFAWLRISRERCPKCAKGRLRTVKRERVRLAGSSSLCWREVKQCPKCGYKKVSYIHDDHYNHPSNGTPPIWIGGSPGRGSSTFSGGTFGGGTFGGGGSGGHF